MPKISGETRAGRRRVLIEAGWQLLAQSGYRDLTVDDVCREANVSKGAFYGYFPHKRTLLLALLEDDSDQVERAMQELEERRISAGERLRAFTATILARAQAPGYRQLAADLWAAMPTDREVHAALSAVVARKRRRLRGWLEDGIARGELSKAPANALASLLLALGDGLTLQAGLDPTAFRWENIQLTVDLLLRALDPP